MNLVNTRGEVFPMMFMLWALSSVLVALIDSAIPFKAGLWLCIYLGVPAVFIAGLIDGIRGYSSED